MNKQSQRIYDPWIESLIIVTFDIDEGTPLTTQGKKLATPYPTAFPETARSKYRCWHFRTATVLPNIRVSSNTCLSKHLAMQDKGRLIRFCLFQAEEGRQQ